jgi:hypothetical protein
MTTASGDLDVGAPQADRHAGAEDNRTRPRKPRTHQTDVEWDGTWIRPPGELTRWIDGSEGNAP